MSHDFMQERKEVRSYEKVAVPQNTRVQRAGEAFVHVEALQSWSELQDGPEFLVQDELT